MSNREVNLIGGFYKDSSLPWSAQDTVNWLPVPAQEAGTRSPMKLRGAPGLRGLDETVIVCSQVPGDTQLNTFTGVNVGSGRATIRAVSGGVYASTAGSSSSSSSPVEFKRLSSTLSLVSDESFTPAGNRPSPGSSIELQLVGINQNRVSIGEDGNVGLLDLQVAGSWRAYLYPNGTAADNWAFGFSNNNRSSHVWFSDSSVYVCFTRSNTLDAAADPLTYRIYRWPLSAAGLRVTPDAQSIKFNDGSSAAGGSFLFHRDRQGFIHAYNPHSNTWRVFNPDLSLSSQFNPSFTVSGPIGVDGDYLFHGGASVLAPGQRAIFIRRRSDYSLVREVVLPFLTSATESFNFGITFNEQVIVVQIGGLAATIPYPLVCAPA